MSLANTVVNYFELNKHELLRDQNLNVLDFIDNFSMESEEIYHEIMDTGRWESHEFTVFKFDDGSMVGVEHSEGLTEYQDSTGVTDVYVVESREVTRTEYFKVY